MPNPIREYRFWSKEKKRMFKCYAINFEHKFVEDKELRTYPFKDIVLMQSTGIKDKNGKEIYEGDIVEILIPNRNREFQRYIKAKIVYIKGCFWFEGGGYTDCNWHQYPQSEIKIIGNIYQNPELLNT